MTERELWLQLVKNYPEDKYLSQGSLDNMGVKELQDYQRRYNADRNSGEFNCQFKEWIKNKEADYTAKISDIYKVGNHKVQLVYYGMVYRILEQAGAYRRGKTGKPISISRKKFVEELGLNNNVRKSIREDTFYGHNYTICIAAKANNEEVKTTAKELDKLESVYKELAKEIKDIFFN